MITKEYDKDGSWCWRIDHDNDQSMWVSDEFLQALLEHPKLKEEYAAEEETK